MIDFIYREVITLYNWFSLSFYTYFV